MTLAEWKQLTDQERQTLTTYWYEIGQPRQLGILAEEAANNLLVEIRSLPYVNCVQVAERPKQGVYILVSTGLKAAEKVPDIPERHETFEVVQAGMADAKRRYWECWQVVAFKICGWAEEETRQKMEHLDAPLGESGGVVYYRGALYHLASVLVHEVARGLVGLPLVNLRYSVLAALDRVGNQSYAFPNEHRDYDWAAARRRVGAAFEQAGIDWPGNSVGA
jgi:hypothetical protein